MLLIGQWPYQSKNLAKFLTYIWIFQYVSILIPQFIKLIEVIDNIDHTIECFGPIIYNLGVGIKFCNNIFNRKQKALFDEIQKDWNNITDETEIILLSKYASFAKFLNFGYNYMCYSTMCCYLFLPLSSFIMDIIKPLTDTRPKNLVIFVEFFVDEEKYYFYIMIHSYITTIFGVLAVVSTDMFYTSCVQHACGMLSILGRRLKMINKDTNIIRKFENDFYKELEDAVTQHNKIIKYCERINKTYGDSFFFILGLNMFAMSFTGALIIRKWGLYYDIIRNGMFVGSQLFHLLYYSIQGQHLIDQSLMISDCIYESGWCTISLRMKKIMTIMIMRSLKPITVSAKVFIISLSNFTMVTKASVSYFTVLKSSS
ncbi:PREDICTED: odorant receptor 9a-like [Ceratosolen solmsi marchali]|uniref:Odorant receptor n=1 Tax=Ceratosolen solmsi marchali TaxID=326594 RepID=A0AAJ6YT56_9HYME|nr:PREDICTED: odorant receptor 9a-like [Ceratosolen solmsi marchali]